MHKAGDIVECVEKPGWLDFITRGKTYVVCDTMRTEAGWHYVKILGDDDRGYFLASDMFRAAQPATAA